MGWGLCRGIPRSVGGDHDPFRKLAEWVVRGMWPEVGFDQEAGMRIREEVWSIAREAARQAADLCDPLARAHALRFLPHVRWFAYSQLARDSTGRIAQLTESCPGAMIFAYALREMGGARGRRASKRLLAGVVAGEPLPRLLDRALEAWLEDALDLEGFAAKRNNPHIWEPLRVADEEERTRILGRQRLLIRRATANVPTTLLWIPPPTSFVPEDIPVRPRDCARWFRLVKQGRFHEEGLPSLDADLEANCSAFLSRHAPLIAGIARKRGYTLSGVAMLVRRTACAEGRAPSARTRADRHVEAIFARRDALQEQARIPGLEALLGLEAGVLERNPSLPVRVKPDWDLGPRGFIRALRSFSELEEEGAQMRHCVGRQVGRALTGHSTFWHAEIDGAPLTVETSGDGCPVRVVEVKGVGNRVPTDAELSALSAWGQKLSATTARDPVTEAARALGLRHRLSAENRLDGCDLMAQLLP